MMRIYPWPGQSVLANALAGSLADLDACTAALALHAFPDGETLVEVEPPAAGGDALIACTLDHPDVKTVPLLLAARTLRELGAARVGLVAPYLAYMRQDGRFRPGQALSAHGYAVLLTAHFDGLVTVDPHLHRIRDLAEIYAMPTRVVHAAPALAAWIRDHVRDPLVIGPDGESAQWAADVAARAGAPLIVLGKQRFGDTDVRVSVPDLARWPGRTPVLIDDIISSGRTAVATLAHLRAAGTLPPVCVAVHGLFAGDALDQLHKAGAARVVTTTSVPHATAQIDISALIAASVRDLWHAPDAANPEIRP